ncbi:MAG: hypothetical protein M5R40_14905 [Anaerolineae bacterium]|nr:hypothetical protein [Anaerolineae bacterium]
MTFEDDEEYLNGSLDLTLQTPDGEGASERDVQLFPAPVIVFV